MDHVWNGVNGIVSNTNGFHMFSPFQPLLWANLPLSRLHCLSVSLSVSSTLSALLWLSPSNHAPSPVTIYFSITHLVTLPLTSSIHLDSSETGSSIDNSLSTAVHWNDHLWSWQQCFMLPNGYCNIIHHPLAVQDLVMATRSRHKLHKYHQSLCWFFIEQHIVSQCFWNGK